MTLTTDGRTLTAHNGVRGFQPLRTEQPLKARLPASVSNNSIPRQEERKLLKEVSTHIENILGQTPTDDTNTKLQENASKNLEERSKGQWNPKAPPTLQNNSREGVGKVETDPAKERKKKEVTEEKKVASEINSSSPSTPKVGTKEAKVQEFTSQDKKTHEENTKKLKEESEKTEKERKNAEKQEARDKYALKQDIIEEYRRRGYEGIVSEEDIEKLDKLSGEELRTLHKKGSGDVYFKPGSLGEEINSAIKARERKVLEAKINPPGESSSKESGNFKVATEVGPDGYVEKTKTENGEKVVAVDPQGNGHHKAESEHYGVKTASKVTGSKISIFEENKHKDNSVTRTEVHKAPEEDNVYYEGKVEKNEKPVVEEKAAANQVNLEQRIEPNGDIERTTTATTTDPKTDKTEQTEQKTTHNEKGTKVEISEGKRDTNKGNLEYGVETNGGKTTVTTKNGDVYTEATLTENERGKVEQFIERVQGGKKLNGEGDVKVVKNKDGNILVVTNEGKVIPIDTRLEQAAEYLDWGGGKVKDGASNAWNWVKSWF